jgi:pimeloyl-ACP methyl ester carboxylesterase
MSTMSAQDSVEGAPAAPIWGELRYSGELASLLALTAMRPPRRRPQAPPVLLIPGFMAGDASLAMMRRWLRRRGHAVSMSGILANVDCAERIVSRLELQLQDLAADSGRRVVLIGQSRGGALARALAVRDPQSVSALVTLGSPVCDSLAVSAPVLRTVRWMARLGDLGLPGVFSSRCAEGECCEEFREHLRAPLAEGIEAVAVHSRSDGIVDWRACLDPHAERVEVDSSHCGMSVHPAVYRLLERVLDAAERAPDPLAAAA